ncbi:MAG: hypothetical protein PHS96_05210 [Anaerolineales bacterium]|nr:hypothetical protein [Anaerolineales bacterium]
MIRFERALEDCLDSLVSGRASLDECLARYPQHAARLRPLLEAARGVGRGSSVHPSPSFKQSSRARLMAHMRAHPRRQVKPRFGAMASIWRSAFNLAAIVLALFIAVTASAQTAMPGDMLYGWKLFSESAWRSVSPDPLGTDLALAERRMDELLAASDDPSGRQIALQGYQQVLTRLAGVTDPAMRALILPILTAQRDRLAQAGMAAPALDEYLSTEDLPLPTPMLPVPTLAQPTPGLALPTSSPLPMREDPTAVLPAPAVELTLPAILPELSLPSLFATQTP